jgi:predicted TIM-barrel fold metal-dependent hydrolase
MEAQATLRAKERAHFGGHHVIDVDTHLSEPHDLWTRRASGKLKDRVPQVKVKDGQRTWVIDEDRVINYATSPTSVVLPDGSKSHGYDWLKYGLEDVHPASTWRMQERLAYMDGQGVAAQIVYPNVLGFGGQHAGLVDADLRLASTQIFNDAMAEMQAESGGRMYPMALMPWWDPALTVKEAERCHAMGLRGVNINTDPQLHRGLDGEMLPDLGAEYWNPVWEVCSSLDLPVNFHVGSTTMVGAEWLGTQAWKSLNYQVSGAINSSMLYQNNAKVMANLIGSGIADRYPKIKFVSVESGIGWVPNLLETLDYQLNEMSSEKILQRKPSEYFPTNFYGTFWFERRNLGAMIKAVGVDNVMFETDFPHPTCLLPIDDVAAAMDGLTEAEKAKVLNGNAQRVYNIRLPG